MHVYVIASFVSSFIPCIVMSMEPLCAHGLWSRLQQPLPTAAMSRGSVEESLYGPMGLGRLANHWRHRSGGPYAPLGPTQATGLGAATGPTATGPTAAWPTADPLPPPPIGTTALAAGPVSQPRGAKTGTEERATDTKAESEDTGRWAELVAKEERHTVKVEQELSAAGATEEPADPSEMADIKGEFQAKESLQHTVLDTLEYWEEYDTPGFIPF